jgi:D-beta-D-heptose 7-phosphate kinase / D-beta-D-heptose 1-phosphate adenosyltransferase
MINFSNSDPKILVIGDLIIDHYLWGTSDRISPEAPVPVVKINNESTMLGGAGNVLNNLKALGAKADILSVVGDCKNSLLMKSLLEKISINTEYLITEKNRITSKKSRIIISQQQIVRFDQENSSQINKSSQEKILNYFKKLVGDYDCLLLSDYGKGLFSNELTQSIINIANLNNTKVLIDPKGPDFSKYRGSYLLTPNIKEASEATKINIQDDSSLKKAIISLKSKCDLNISLITLSNQGIAVYDNEFRTHPTAARKVFDVTGAGDTVLAALGFALASNCSIDESVQFSNLAAGVVVGKVGSASATLNEISEYESRLNKSTSDKHIKTQKEITYLAQDLKKRGLKIIFTNGCFDIIHSGHIKYLEAAKSFGDILIVGINSDQSVSSIKGKSRPINSEKDRSLVLAALESVDYVVIFNDDTPYNLIRSIMPEILVKGGDYKNQKVIGSDIVDELRLVEFIDGKSTSKIINKIKNI